MNLSLGLLKTAADREGERLLAREARWLRELERVPELEGRVPRVLQEGVSPEGRHYLIISTLPAGGEMRAFTPGHARFLASLRKARFRAAEFEVSGTCRWLQGSLDSVARFVPPPDAELLGECYRDCETALLYWTGPYVLSQGDFAPWNIRSLGEELFVSDWGRARADASPLDDVLHYLMAQRALGGQRLTVPMLRQAMRRAGEFACDAYPEWHWRAPVIGALTLVYLLGTVLERALAAQRINRADLVVGSYWNLLEKRSTWMNLEKRP